MKPIIALNLKTYKKSSLENSITIAKTVENISKKYKRYSKFILAPNTIDLKCVSKYLKNTKLFSQHVDPVEPGKSTGKIVPYYLKKIGVKGSIVNHSEDRMKLVEIKNVIEILNKFSLESLVCVENLKEAKKIAKLNPTYIAFEDPKLIGTGIPISKAKSNDVKKFVSIVRKNSDAIPLCGAGISSAEDVKAALELGTEGVLIASAFVKSRNKKSFLEKIIETLKGV